MSKLTVIDLRNKVEAVMLDLAKASADGHVPNTVVIADMRANHSDMMRKLRTEIDDIVITKLISDVGSRKMRKAVSGPDLFGEYHGVPLMISLGKGRKRTTLKASIREADLWLAAHEAHVPPEGAVKNPDFRRLLDDLRPFAKTTDDTIEICMARKAASDGKGKASGAQ